MDETTDLIVIKQKGAEEIYERDFQAEAKRTAREQLRNNNIPQSAEADTNERRVKEAATGAMNAQAQSHQAHVAGKLQQQQDITFDPDTPEDELQELDNQLQAQNAHFQDETKQSRADLKEVESDLASRRQDSGITREPKPSIMAKIFMLACYFMLFEAVFTIFATHSGHIAMFEAITISLAIGLINVGLGGYVTGGMIWPYCFRINGGRHRWLAISSLIVAVLFVVSANFVLWQFRTAENSDFSQVSFQADLANLIGFMLFIVGLLFAGYWFYRFATSRDHYLEYGRLGTLRQEIRDHLKVTAGHYRDQIITLSEAFDQELKTYRQTARNLAKQSAQLASQCEAEGDKFVLNQQRIASVYQEVTELMRHDVRGILGDKTPAWFDEKPDYSDLILPLPATQTAQSLAQTHQEQCEAVIEAIRTVKAKQKTLIEDYLERLNDE